MKSKYDEAAARKLLSEGDVAGFKHIYDRYAPGVFRVGYKYLQSQELAEDLLQDVFYKIWKNPERYAKVENFETYLFSVAKNICFRKLKKLAQEDEASLEYALRKGDASNYNQEYSHLLQQAVEQLPPQQKLVFKLVREEGMSHDAIAHQLQLSAATVNNHVSLAMKFIRNHVFRHIGLVVGFIVNIF
jgi:RNA polymerase sigma-70 factor (family 1)